jgi:hypothetical protein
VFFAAWMPAIRATPSGSTFGTFPDLIALIVDGATFNCATALAVRSEFDFDETSRIGQSD